MKKHVIYFIGVKVASNRMVYMTLSSKLFTAQLLHFLSRTKDIISPNIKVSVD